jgi:phosphomannomutase
MTLIKSISGIRGTIGGAPGDGLTPPDIVKFVSAYAVGLRTSFPSIESPAVVIGRDARISGEIVSSLVCSTLQSMGLNVVDLGLSTTPTVEMAVPHFKAQGGIIITASHNPEQWNALKMLNDKGEFISAKQGENLLQVADRGEFEFAQVRKLGSYRPEKDYLKEHIRKILELDLVDVDAIKKADFTVVVDPVNSSGAIAVPEILKACGVKNIVVINEVPNGRFAHNPEPLPEHLVGLSAKVKETGAQLGISVDPDVDRLALVCENGEMFGEEYTLVAVADHVLSVRKGGNTVSNLSSTRALKDVTEKHGGSYNASAVGEVNVVEKMKSTNAVIGGEGNGGVIVPDLHYGRDALAGIAIFLTLLARSGKSTSALRKSFPNYYISKNKIELSPEIDVDRVLKELQSLYRDQKIDLTDGVRIDIDKEWVHLRKSNTEPIIRIIAESQSADKANALAMKIIAQTREITGIKTA